MWKLYFLPNSQEEKKMSFMQEILKHNIPIWDNCLDTSFVRELQSGKLPFEKFKQYMIQDSIYLKYYARIYGKAIYHSNTLQDIQMFYSVLSFVTDTESAVRLNYLKQFDMTDDDIELIEPLPENQEYIDFMLEVAGQGNICEILMTVLPCMLSYSYIFRKVADEPESKSSRYWDFIQDYADNRYFEDCKTWCTFADTKCDHLPEANRKRLCAIFEKASLLELNFWNMAYR
jgi:thiaminase/transcriptional activator TenA